MAQTAADYEGLAARILRRASLANPRRALAALERPLPACPGWTSLDLVVRADCRSLVELCPDLCLAAVQRRFFGVGGITAALARGKISLGIGGLPCWAGAPLLTKLLVCVAIDAVGIWHTLSRTSDTLSDALDVVTAPLSAWLLHRLYGRLLYV